MARGFLLLMIAVAVHAETLDDAVAALAKKISARLEVAETARVTSRNISSLPPADAAKIQTTLTRALQRRVRNPMPVEVALTIAEKVRGYLLVAEIRRENETAVEMTEFQSTPSAAPARAAFTIESKLLWEQEIPILDIVIFSDSMLVLDTAGVTRYEKIAGKWERAASMDLPTAVRDPRGRLETTGDSVTIHTPGFTCTASSKLTAPPQCDEGGRFKADRNTQDLHDWRGEFFASSELGSDTLLAGLDGRIHIYDTAHAPQAVFDGWGSDFAGIAACGDRHLVVTGPGDANSPDSITLYHLVNRAPVRISEPIGLAGPVTALWPAGDSAIAVARNLSTGKYAAYSLTLDCGR